MAGPFDIVVLGGGIAGLTAVHHALLGGCSVGHVLGTEPIGGLVCNVGELQGYPAGAEPQSGIGLAVALSAANGELGAEAYFADASALEPDGTGFAIATSDGTIRAKQVIVATGARLRMLDVPGAGRLVGRGVSQCAWCDGALYKDKHVIVVGSGDAALEEALHLSQDAAKVSLLARGAHFRARQSYIDRIVNLVNVNCRWSTEVTEVLGQDTVEAVRIKDRNSETVEDMPCDGVFVFIGLAPNTALLDGLASINPDGGIDTTEAMETATPGLFAIGAVRSGYRGRLVHAVADAATAAMTTVANCRS